MAGGITTAKTGRLPYDADLREIQVAKAIVTETVDEGGSALVSPKTSVPVTPVHFAVPTNALVMIFKASATARFGENATLDGSATLKGYSDVVANTEVEVPCAGMSYVYIRAATGTVTLTFRFEILNNS